MLLVEDDSSIRLATAEMLANLGHTVAEAANASQAFVLLEQRAFDILMTDLALPGLGGEELAARAIGQQPGLRVVFASGYDGSPEPRGPRGIDWRGLAKEAVRRARCRLRLERRHIKNRHIGDWQPG